MEETKALKQALVLSHVVFVFLLHNPTNALLSCFVLAWVCPLILLSVLWAVDDASLCLSLALYYVCVFGMNSAWYVALWRRNTRQRDAHKHGGRHMISKSIFFFSPLELRGAWACMCSSVTAWRRVSATLCLRSMSASVCFTVALGVFILLSCEPSV